MRIVVVGQTSFLAQHILATARAQGLDAVAVTHADDLAMAMAGAGAVVNCAIAPAFRTQPYNAVDDFDLTVARQAAQAGAHFTMLSTRRVYPAAQRWNAREDHDASGDETTYGQNKARSEAAIRALAPGSSAIFRLSNIFGQEYRPGTPRPTFMGAMLASLQRNGTILFDMDPRSQRDFLPVETMAQVIVHQMREGISGLYNLGCGFALPCADIADWVMEGFGGGTLIAKGDIRGEFYLNMEKTMARFGTAIDKAKLYARCVAIGQDLRCQKS